MKYFLHLSRCTCIVFLLSMTLPSYADDKVVEFTVPADKNMAIIYHPTDATINAMKAEGEDDFYVTADDAMYYLYTAQEYLESTNILLHETEADILRLIYPDTGKQLELLLKESAWGIYFVRPDMAPIKADMSLIKDAYTTYFSEE